MNIETKKVKVSEVKENPGNPRFIRDEKFIALVQSIRDFPEMADIREIVVNKDMVILGGNMRFKAMKEAGWTEVPIRIVDLTPEQEREFIVKDNISGGEWNFEMLSNEYEAFELEEWGLDLPDLGKVEEVEEDEPPEVSQEEPRSRLGGIYSLGRHKVMSGDSTNSDDITKLIGGAQVDMVYTDPPYGINEKGDRSKRGGIGKGGLAKAKKYDDFIDDSIDYAVNAFGIINEIGIKRQVWWGANYYAHHIPQSNNWFVWDKRVEDNQKDTQSDCELAWVKSEYSSIRIFRHLWKGMMKGSEHGQGRVHPTQKPIALAVWAFDYFKDVTSVLDLFLGSGSTLIACEQTGRTCYGMELDPGYVDVIRKRYWKFMNNGDESGWEEATPEVEYA